MISQFSRVNASTLTPLLFSESSAARTMPVVITGALDAAFDWSLDFICESLGEQEYSVRVYGDDYHLKPKREWTKYCEIRKFRIRSYVQLLRSRTAHQQSMYLAQVPLGKTSLADTVLERFQELSDKCNLRPESDINLWLGPGGHVEPLHFDLGDGTLVQVHGTKHVTLFPPSQSANLYPFPPFHAVPSHFSQVDTQSPDFTIFPGYREAIKHCSHVLLAQGEILFIPSRWWHEVSAIGDDYVCSLNRFWSPSGIESRESRLKAWQGRSPLQS